MKTSFELVTSRPNWTWEIQLEKTAVIPIGGNYDINDKLCPELALSWEDNFILPGFKIDNRLKKLNNNYEKCVKKVHEIKVGLATGSHLRATSPLQIPSYYLNLFV